MEENRESFTINLSEDEKTQKIIGFTVLMLSRRIFMDDKKEKQELLHSADTSKVTDEGDNVYTIKARNGKRYAIKIIYGKLTSSGKNSPISEFIKNYSNDKKIIIASEFTSKINDFSNKNGVQIFQEGEMLRDLLKQRDQPEHQLLSPSEMENVKKEYFITSYTTYKTPKSDPIVRYFELKKSDIYRVIRPSPTSGYTTAYRIVT